MRRLLLFDIDGTLLSTNGAARRAFHRALLEVYGTTGPIATHVFDGKTDPQIARELMRLAGFGDQVIDSGLNALWNAYLRELAHELAQPGHETRLFPGVRALLAALKERDAEVCVGLLTGNIARGAALKLSSGRIDHHFAFGAYGSDCERRDGLPAVAVARARDHTGRAFTGREVVIIGDTPHDVTCGQALGVFTLAVATGRHSTEDLLRAGADVALPDLSKTDFVLETLLAA
ncbi:MAG TPA: HAD hydrolase-like protein [Longimicrobiales bacterium]|nr:HAD hydrolase-like protein [Longimicrobiales bacterium]